MDYRHSHPFINCFIPFEMKLSEYLTLAEVIRSDSAKRLGIDNIPGAVELDNLKAIGINVYDKIRTHFRCPIYVSSGFRSKRLNRALNGSATLSQHCKGEALDLDQDGSPHGVTNREVFDYIKNNLLFDQLIAEFPKNGIPDWVHVSYKKNGIQRKEILIAKKVYNKTIYIQYKTDNDLI